MCLAMVTTASALSYFLLPYILQRTVEVLEIGRCPYPSCRGVLG